MLQHTIDPITLSPFFKPIMGHCFHSVSQSVSGEDQCPHCREDWKNKPKIPDTLLDKLTCEFILSHIQKDPPSIIKNIFEDHSKSTSLQFTERDSEIALKKWKEGKPKLEKNALLFLPTSRSDILSKQAFRRIYQKITTETHSLLYKENTHLPPHLYQIQKLMADCLEKEPHTRFPLAKSDWYLAESQIERNPKSAIETFKKALDTCYDCLILLNIQQIDSKETIMDKLIYDVIDIAIATHSKLVYLLPEPFEKKYHITKALKLYTLGTDLLTKYEENALSPEKLAQISISLKNNSDWCTNFLEFLQLPTDATSIKFLSEKTQFLKLQTLFTTYSNEMSFQTKNIAHALGLTIPST